MQIHGLQHSQAAQSLTGASRNAGAQRSAAATPSATLPADELELSAEAQSLSQMQAAAGPAASGDIRWERVNELRQAIASGNFESQDRLNGTVDRILDAFA